jgi:hypothetical protein
VPLYPPRTLAPVKQLQALAKREAALRGLLTRGGPEARVEAAAENVRHAQLAVLKARRSLIEFKKESKEKRQQLEGIAEDESAWRNAIISSIIARYSERRASNNKLQRTRGAASESADG